jgi:hypothetical protein
MMKFLNSDMKDLNDKLIWITLQITLIFTMIITFLVAQSLSALQIPNIQTSSSQHTLGNLDVVNNSCGCISSYSAPSGFTRDDVVVCSEAPESLLNIIEHAPALVTSTMNVSKSDPFEPFRCLNSFNITSNDNMFYMCEQDSWFAEWPNDINTTLVGVDKSAFLQPSLNNGTSISTIDYVFTSATNLAGSSPLRISHPWYKIEISSTSAITPAPTSSYTSARYLVTRKLAHVTITHPQISLRMAPVTPIEFNLTLLDLSYRKWLRDTFIFTCSSETIINAVYLAGPESIRDQAVISVSYAAIAIGFLHVFLLIAKVVLGLVAQGRGKVFE